MPRFKYPYEVEGNPGGGEDEEEFIDYQCPECGYELSNCLCIQFQNPGSNSALRKATPYNRRGLPCPTCGGANLLTPEDVILDYQCDECADRQERGGY